MERTGGFLKRKISFEKRCEGMGGKGRGEVVSWRLGERALVRVLELEGVEQRELRRSSPRIRAEA